MDPPTKWKSEAEEEVHRAWKNDDGVDECPACGSEDCAVTHEPGEYVIRCRDYDNEHRVAYQAA